LVVKILRRERYQVLEAASAAEAIAIAALNQIPIDLLLTDVLLSDANGRKLAQDLLKTCPDLKVIYVSGFTGDKSLRRDFPPDARYLQKPFTLAALTEAVREALDQ
jgi:CheY-like chemotaxis protein